MKKFVGLGAKRCAPCEAGKAVKLAPGDVTRLRNQVPGWKLTEDAGGVECLRQEWKVKNFTSGGVAGTTFRSVCGCFLHQCLSGPRSVGCMAFAPAGCAGGPLVHLLAFQAIVPCTARTLAMFTSACTCRLPCCLHALL